MVEDLKVRKEYKTPISRMGCVDGLCRITYKIKDGSEAYDVSFLEFWNALSYSHNVVIHSEDGLSSDYMDLNDIEILDVDGFVDCKRIIRNPNVNDWYEVKLKNGKKLICTSDHFWSTVDKRVIRSIDLSVGDLIPCFDCGVSDYSEVSEITFLGVRDDNMVSYDVTTESSHFICDGIRSHNCRAQLSPWFVNYPPANLACAFPKFFGDSTFVQNRQSD